MGGLWAEQLLGARWLLSTASIRVIVPLFYLSGVAACTLDFDRFKPSTAADATMAPDEASSGGSGAAADARASRPDSSDGGDASLGDAAADAMPR